jgi:hypothetical protein
MKVSNHVVGTIAACEIDFVNDSSKLASFQTLALRKIEELGTGTVEALSFQRPSALKASGMAR